MGKITGFGFIAGALVWLAIMIYASTKSECVKFNVCGGKDLFLFAIIGLGMLVPAWVVAFLVSNIVNAEKYYGKK